MVPKRFARIWVRPSAVRWQLDWNSIRLQELVLNRDLGGRSRHGLAQQVRRAVITEQGHVRDDDFDRHLVPFDRNQTALRMRARVIEGKSWAGAGVIDWMASRIANGETLDRVSDMDGITERYELMDQIIADGRRMGRLRSRAEINGALDERGGITVAFGRDGQLIFLGRGTHRLAIARCLNLEAVPVSLCAMHRRVAESGEWRHSLLPDPTRTVRPGVRTTHPAIRRALAAPVFTLPGPLVPASPKTPIGRIRAVLARLSAGSRPNASRPSLRH